MRAVVLTLLACLMATGTAIAQVGTQPRREDSQWQVPTYDLHHGAAPTDSVVTGLKGAGGSTTSAFPTAPVSPGRWVQVGNYNTMYCAITGPANWYPTAAQAAAAGYTSDCQFTFRCEGGTCATPDPS